MLRKFKSPLMSPIPTSVSRDNPENADKTDMVLYLAPSWTGDADDLSAEENDGTLNGNASIDANGFNIPANTPSDNVSISSNSTLDLDSSWTVSIWFKLNDSTQTGDLDLCRRFHLPSLNGWGFYWDGDDDLVKFINYTSGSWDVYLESTNTFTDENWHHACIINNGSTIKLYVDSVEEDSIASASVVNYPVDLTLGEYDFVGKLADFRIYGTAETPNTLYNQGKWRLTGTGNMQVLNLPMSYTAALIDISEGKQTGVLEGSASITGDGLVLNNTAGDKACFSASSDFAVGDNHTFQMWVKRESTARQTIFSYGVDTASHYGFILGYNQAGGGKYGIYVSSTGSSWDILDADAGGSGIASSGGTIDTWELLTVVKEGANYRMYINTTKVLDVTSAGTVTDLSSSRFNLGWNAYSGSSPLGWSLDGAMDYVKMFRRAITTNELSQIYEQEKEWRKRYTLGVGSWSASNNLNTARVYLAGCGTQTAGLSFGGYDTTYSTVTEEYDGTSWTASNNLNTARYYLAGCGTQTAGLSFGGYDTTRSAVTEEYDGTSWVASNNLNTARYNLAGCGTQTAGLSFGGSTGSYSAVTEEYDGTSWTASNNLNTARYVLAGCGTQTAGLSFGGSTGSISAVTEEYDGTSWSASNNLNTARHSLAGCGTQTAGLSFGGYDTTYSTVTEEYDGTSWTASNNLNTARRGLAGCGIQRAGLSFGGTTGSNSAVTEEYSQSLIEI
jgi:hypothetical protein